MGKPAQQQPVGKWLEFIYLSEALDAEGCPICELVERACQKYLDGLFYESVNDVGTRLRLARSQGFCNWHAWMATRRNSTNLGIAIIYEDLLSRVQERANKLSQLFDEPKARSRNKRRVLKFSPLLPVTATCPTCDIARFTERTFLHELLEQFKDAELSAKFRSSFGLCLPHLELAVSQYPDHPHLSELLEVQREKFDKLRSELQEFIRKFDYRFTNEPKGREQTAWLRAVELFAGKREVCSSPLPSP